jgi:hypothetical protein
VGIWSVTIDEEICVDVPLSEGTATATATATKKVTAIGHANMDIGHRFDNLKGQLSKKIDRECGKCVRDVVRCAAPDVAFFGAPSYRQIIRPVEKKISTSTLIDETSDNKQKKMTATKKQHKTVDLRQPRLICLSDLHKKRGREDAQP